MYHFTEFVKDEKCSILLIKQSKLNANFCSKNQSELEK